jgi:ADP-heptose:LPS heptosyltransferase
MNVLVLQLKRIGDLVLTTPALAALRAKFPEARITLVVDEPCKSLVPTLPAVDEGLLHSRRISNRDVWRRIRRGKWDVCLDFTGTDRSALMTWLSRAKQRITFDWVRKRWLRRLAYREFVNSAVRLSHTSEHYLDLLQPLGIERGADSPRPTLRLSDEERTSALNEIPKLVVQGDYVLIHPGTARPEKYWLAERWAEVIHALRLRGYQSLITCGPDAFERGHAEEICRRTQSRFDEIQPSERRAMDERSLFAIPWIVNPGRLSYLAAYIEAARLVISCDTAVVHLAAAFQKPQIALFGPTNPFHWRPIHERAVIISAAQPDSPTERFFPKMKGAPMDQILTRVVLASAESLLGQAGSD